MALLPRSCLECAVRGPHCFCSLDVKALGFLDGIGARRSFGVHERVLWEGAAPEHVYVVCRGTIKLTTSSKDGRLLILRIAGPGDVLGLAAALKGSKYEATAETLEPVDVKAIRRDEFLRFMEEFRAVSRNSAEAVAREYDAVVLSARRLALSGSAAAKLASVLLEWGQMSGGREAGQMRFRMPLTHEELGHMAGMSRETATRVLAGFRRDGLLEVDGDWMRVVAPERMERMYR